MSVKSLRSTTHELPALLRSALGHGRVLRAHLPGIGRVHIDHPVPFLCVYRQPFARPDPGTRQLLEGEASHLIVDETAPDSDALGELCLALLSELRREFGAALLLEIWTREVTDKHDGDASQPPEFRIVAPEHDAPETMLETLESALLQIRVAEQSARVDVSYEREPSAPGLPPLLSQLAAQELGVVRVGLEIAAVYRDPSTLVLFPHELRELHQGLTHALKRGLHAFTTSSTSQQPAHYNELGRHALTQTAWEADEKLAQLSSGLDLLLHVTPVNSEAAWSEFKASRFERTPQFHYRPRPIDPGLAKRELYAIPIETVEDAALEHLYSCKRDELDRQISMVGDRNTARFLHGSLQVYGSIDEALLWEAESLIDAVNEREAAGVISTAQPAIDAEAFAMRARELLAVYADQAGETVARVEVRHDVSGLLVSNGNLLIGHDTRVSEGRADAALAHEIETHVLTHYNGRQQRFRQLAVGTAGYEALQEGLAVLAEFLVGELDAHRLRLLGARVLAVASMIEGADFIETFRRLRERCGLPPRSAFATAMRVHRGGGFAKDLIYLRGLSQLLAHVRAGNDLSDLYVGKLALEQLPMIEELRWRRVVKAPNLLPRFLSTASAQTRLASLAQTRSVLDLLPTDL